LNSWFNWAVCQPTSSSLAASADWDLALDGVKWLGSGRLFYWPLPPQPIHRLVGSFVLTNPGNGNTVFKNRARGLHPERKPYMRAKILTFSSQGDTTLLEYDPATADMEEVKKVIAEYEAKTGAQPFDMATGERIVEVTRQQEEILMVHPIAGG
jgi:hypothetical protein